MQDFQPLPGRVFGGGGGAAAGGGGGGGAELRRLASYPATAARHQQQQPVKCPRCDSTNTKFCYYNNYNLSQPRHFCKSCRRYWTMGGVLRNVPVGGGCRKSKRPFSSSKPSPAAEDEDPDHRRRRRPSSSASRCSSDSSSLTASTSAPFPDPTLLTSHSQIPISDPNPPFEPLPADPPLCPAPYFFQDPAAGSFTATEATPAAILGFSLPEQPTVQEKAAAVNGPGFIDQTVPVDSMPHGGGGGLPAMDWPGPVDPMLFDLTSAVDAAAYWNESHWVDADPSLYLP